MYSVPVAGYAPSQASISIDTNISSSNLSSVNASITNATINNLTTTIFNPVSINCDSLDVQNLTVDNSIVLLNVETLNVSTKNVCQLNVINASMTNISVQNISCTSFTSPDVQPLLIAGDNVSILNNIINVTNDALLPSNANFSSINTSSLSVNNDVIIGGTTYITDLIVSDVINCSTIQANNLSTAEMQFGNSLAYVAVAKILEVNTTDTISSGNTLPVTSGAVYNAINTQTTTISTMWSYMLSEPEFVLVNSTINSGIEDTICYLDITPQYEGSKIHVEFCFSYSVTGFGTDSIVTEIRVGKNNNVTQTIIQELFQEWTNGAGGGTRSGASGTISASYQNTDTLGKYNRIQLRVDNNSDDTWGLDSVAFVSIKVIEFIETAGTSNPNILIGSGNISCGNISCNTITALNHTIDNLITTENVNVGGSMVTVGFPESGVIVPSSMVRLAGGAVVQNYADMAWDGTTFNISTRQATKNFKVSFGQVAYLEVDSTNVSVQSLKVNQGLEVLGSLTYNDLILNDSLLLNGTLLAFGATFRDDVIFERDVDIEQTLNVSNINVSGNIVCAGTISGTNISTAALIPGTNITITNNIISAFVQSDADIVISSLHVDNNANIYGVLNVSETSNFGQSLNVDNQLFVGKAGEIDGNLVIYSTNIGDNFQIQNYSDSATGFIGNGNISKFNFSLGGNRTLTIKPTQVNISGDLIVSGNITGTLSFENLSATNLSVGTMTVNSIEGDLNAENILCDTVTTTGHVETGKWFIGASNTTTASLYNKDISSVTTHYALHQTNGGGTSLNGTAVYFKNNGTDVGEWTSTGLSIGKTTPTTTLDVLGDSLFTGEVDIVGNTIITGNVNISGILDADDIVLDNISNINFSGNQITANQIEVSGHIETGKWLIGSSDTTTSSLYNKDITSVTTHYALRQTNGGATSLNGTAVYFKNNGTDVGEWTATGLGVGKTTPTKKLDVLGDSLFTGDINVCGSIYSDNVSSTIVNTPLVTSNILDLDGTERILFNIDNVPHMELIEDELYLYVDCIAQTMNVQQKLDGLNMSMTNISTARLTSTNASFTNISTTRITATTINTGDVIATGTIDTFELLADEATINFLTVSSNLTTDEVLCDYVHATVSILSDGPLVVTGTTTLSGKVNISNDMNISGQLEAETFVGTLQTSLINVPTINVSTLNVSDLINNTEMRTPLINASTINSSFVLTPTLLNVSYLWSDGTIDFRTNTLPTLAMNNASAKFFQDVNISGTLRADAIEGIDLLNICSTNISTTNLSATTTSSNHINCSTLTVLDTGGAGGLDVTGVAYFRSGFFSYEDAYMEANDNYFGDPAGTELRSRINFWSQKAAYQVGAQFGCDTDDIVRLKLERFGLYTQYNINISNVSTMDMDNTSTKFHQDVNISGTLTADNISGANLSTAAFLLGSGLTFALNTLSADFTSVETTIANEIATEVDTSLVNATTANIGFLKVDGIANISYLNASNVCFTNLSATNLSATNVSATTLTTSSALLDERVAGSMYLSQKDKIEGYNYALKQTSAGGTSLNTVGNSNLNLNVNNVTIATIDVDGFNVSVSNMSQLNISNISAINLDLTGNLTNNDILLNFKIDILSDNLSSGAVFLICLDDGGDNECNGKFYYNRNTGNDGSGFVDIVVSSKETAGDTPHGFCSYQTAHEAPGVSTPHRFSLITGTFSGVSYVGLKYEGGNAFPFGEAYFDGLWKSTGTNTPFELKLSSDVTSQTALPISISEVSLQNKRLVIDTDGDVTIAGNLTAPTVKHSDDFCRFFAGSNTPFNSAQTSYTAAFNTFTLESTKITKNAAHNRFTINKAGYYKIAANMVYENTTYGDRVVYRAEIAINGNKFNGYGDSFVYVRHSSYGDYGSGFVSTLINLSVNDYVEIYVTLKKGGGAFGAEMSGTQVRFRSAVDFEYLGT
jgi:hypothetical protein